MESLFREFDNVLYKKAVADNRLGLLDASSLLWRLDMMGIEVGQDRWKRVTDALATHVGNHRSPWLVLKSGVDSSLFDFFPHPPSPPSPPLTYTHTHTHTHTHTLALGRFDAHIMMGLAYGKVSECTARLALAQGMIKVLS